MNAKKFIAATSREALKLVRLELGEDAVILSNRKVPGGVEIVAMAGTELAGLSEMRASSFRQPVVHAAVQGSEMPGLSSRALNQAAALGAAVLSAAPRADSAPAQRGRTDEAQHLLNELRSMQGMLQEQMATMAWSHLQHQDPRRSGLLRDMLNAGFSPALSSLLLDKMPADADVGWVRRILAHNLRVVPAHEDVVARGGAYALVGPTGVGKTTTTAKLAARAVVRHGADKVALVTTDSYRIGAHEQLHIYARILGVAVHAVRDASDLRLTLSGLKHKHLVLIDTMGIGQRDSRVAEQARMFDGAGVKRLLLLNAASAGSTLEDVVRMYGGSGAAGCIPTKLDEAVALGTVLDVVARHRLVMHYIASGQRVPEDLHEVNLEYLLHRTFKEAGKPAAFAVSEMEFPAFMAGATGMAGARGQHAL